MQKQGVRPIWHFILPLIIGSVLLTSGIYFTVRAADSTPLGNPGDLLHLEQILAARKVVNNEWVGSPTELGRFIGAYLISFARCDDYLYMNHGGPGAGDYLECEPNKLTIATGFGMMYYDSQNKPVIAVPLPGSIYRTSYSPSVPATLDGKMLWGAFVLTNLADTPEGDPTFAYRFSGMIGPADSHGQVILQHKLDIKQ